MKNEIHNVLLKRREVVLVMEHHGAPSEAAATEFAADHLKVAAECVAIQSIVNHYGSQTFHVHAYVYDTPEMKQKIEPKKKEKKAAA